MASKGLSTQTSLALLEYVKHTWWDAVHLSSVYGKWELERLSEKTCDQSISTGYYKIFSRFAFRKCCVSTARLNFTGEGCTFYVHDNPFIHAIDEKLQAAKTSSTKLYSLAISRLKSTKSEYIITLLYNTQSVPISYIVSLGRFAQYYSVCFDIICVYALHMLCVCVLIHTSDTLACTCSLMYMNTIVISHACTCQGV